MVVVLAVIGWLYRYRSITWNREEASDQWLKLDDGSQKSIGAIVGSDSNAGKAAKLQFAWSFYWEVGVKKLGSDQRGALNAIDQAGKLYRTLATECADESPPIFAPQAFLGIALVEETRAIQDRAALDKAKEAYKEVRR